VFSCLQGIKWSKVDGIHCYVPKFELPQLQYPLIACDTKTFDTNHISWHCQFDNYSLHVDAQEIIKQMKLNPEHQRLFSTVTQYVKTGTFKPKKEEWRKRVAGLAEKQGERRRRRKTENKVESKEAAVQNPLHAAAANESPVDTRARAGSNHQSKLFKVKRGVAVKQQKELPGIPGAGSEFLVPDKAAVRSGVWEEDNGAEFVV
jgi:hypothetical protein